MLAPDIAKTDAILQVPPVGILAMAKFPVVIFVASKLGMSAASRAPIVRTLAAVDLKT